MATKFKNISLENDKDPTRIKKAGNNLLVGIGNVLGASTMTIRTEDQKETDEDGAVEENKVNTTKVCVLVFIGNWTTTVNLTPITVTRPIRQLKKRNKPKRTRSTLKHASGAKRGKTCNQYQMSAEKRVTGGERAESNLDF